MATKTYCGSMDYDRRDGSYSYRGYDVKRVNGRGWVISKDALGLRTDELMLSKKVAIRKSRNAAGNFIDRRIFNLRKAKMAA